MQLDFLLLLVAEKLDLSFSLQLGLARKLEQRGIPDRDGVLAVSVITGNRQLPSSYPHKKSKLLRFPHPYG